MTECEKPDCTDDATATLTAVMCNDSRVLHLCRSCADAALSCMLGGEYHPGCTTLIDFDEPGYRPESLDSVPEFVGNGPFAFAVSAPDEPGKLVSGIDWFKL